MSTQRTAAGREVVVTGVGLVTPLGWGRDATWNALLAGRTAAVWLDELGFHPRWAGMPVPETSLLDPLRLRKFTNSAAEEALSRAAITIGRDVEAARVGCVVGVSKSDLTAYSQWARSVSVPASEVDNGDAGRDLIAAALCPSDPALQLAGRFDIEGAVLCPMAACATGLVSILRGVQLIRDDVCDAVVAGSVDASLTPALLGCYSRLRVLAAGFEVPRRAMRPFDSDRNGFLVGEGAGMLVLEAADVAASRQQTPLARVLGYALGNDPTGMTDVDVSGKTLAHVIRDALYRSGLEPRQIDAVQVHGTATIQNDLCESRALRLVWGNRPPPPVTSIKGAIGHLLGGAGSVETALAVVALQEQILPPAAGLDTLDNKCMIDVSPVARRHEFQRILKLSLGFGGHLAAVVLEAIRHVEPPDRRS